MKRFSLMLLFFVAWVGYTAPSAYVAYNIREPVKDRIDHHLYAAQSVVSKKMNSIEAIISSMTETVMLHGTSLKESALDYAFSWLEVDEHPKPRDMNYKIQNGVINAAYDLDAPPPSLTLSELKKRKIEDVDAMITSQISPSTGQTEPKWQPDQNELFVESVLVPRQVTVISSSQDGQIKDIHFGHGDIFKKGDVLISYNCDDIAAEAEMVKAEKDLTRIKREGSDELFKLDIISNLDRMSAKAEDKQTDAKTRLYEARLKDCQIKAEFDGRVTNKLANPGEYTRTDRVLLEVASTEPLKAEFLIPSKWLRWVNIGAPIEITLNETEKNYIAKIERIHGEIDPVSQSIQVIAALEPYDDPLLPGMSGQAKIDVSLIRAAGVRGYLESVQVSKTQ